MPPLLALLLAGSLGLANPPQSVLDELRTLVKADQESRIHDRMDAEADEQRKKRVLALLAEGRISSAEAQECAALILQHTGLTLCDGKYQAISLDNYLLAHMLAKSAAEKGRHSARGLAAACLDRYLVFSGKPQKYGTQILFDPETKRMVIPPVDPATTDQERAAWGVEPLAELRKRVPQEP